MQDLTGKIFGTIKVIGYNKEVSEEQSKKQNHKRHFYNCKCIKCGTESIKSSGNITKIKTDSTGCKECNSLGDLTNQIFGIIRVIEEDKEETQKRMERYGKSIPYWKTVCTVCGHISSRNGSELFKIRKKGTTGCSACSGVDLTGEKIGRLTVLGVEKTSKTGKRFWLCQCDCGNTVIHETGQLRAKNAPQSCGCLQREAASKVGKKTIHYIVDGVEKMSDGVKRIHNIWSEMRQRCNNPNNHAYKYYGGRGIIVCDEWQDVTVFEKWALENGYEDNLTIDRIDTNGNYEPDNCRWVDMQTQANNTRSNKMLPYHGRTQSLADWCRELSLDYHRTKARLNSCGYTVEQAFELERYAAQKQNNNKRFGVDPTKLQPLPT